MPGHLHETILIAVSTPLYIIVIGAEILASHIHLHKFYSLRGTLMNIYLSLVNGGIDLLFRSVYIFIILQWFYDHHILDFSEHLYIYWPLLFVSEDLAFYL